MEKTISTQDMKDLTDLRKYFMLKNVSVSVPGDCPYCNEHFVDLRLHLNSKKDKKIIPQNLTNFDCDSCQLILPNEECIRNHKENIHGKSRKSDIIIPCKVCNIGKKCAFKK